MLKRPPRLVSYKCEAVHGFRILAKLLKSTFEDFKFWEVADLHPAALLRNELDQKYLSRILLTF